jgi:hypothetical protein
MLQRTFHCCRLPWARFAFDPVDFVIFVHEPLSETYFASEKPLVGAVKSPVHSRNSLTSFGLIQVVKASLLILVPFIQLLA